MYAHRSCNFCLARFNFFISRCSPSIFFVWFSPPRRLERSLFFFVRQGQSKIGKEKVDRNFCKKRKTKQSSFGCLGERGASVVSIFGGKTLIIEYGAKRNYSINRIFAGISMWFLTGPACTRTILLILIALYHKCCLYHTAPSCIAALCRTVACLGLYHTVML